MTRFLMSAACTALYNIFARLGPCLSSRAEGKSTNEIFEELGMKAEYNSSILAVTCVKTHQNIQHAPPNMTSVQVSLANSSAEMYLSSSSFASHAVFIFTCAILQLVVPSHV